MKHGSSTSLRSQIGCQLSGQLQVKAVQATKDANIAGTVLASECLDAQSILFIVYIEKGGNIKSEYYIALLVRLKEEIVKSATNEEEDCDLLPRQCTVSQVNRNNGKTT